MTVLDTRSVRAQWRDVVDQVVADRRNALAATLGERPVA